jgi:hypothetical protein
MIGYVKLQRDNDKEEPKLYLCSRCGAVITHSEALIPLNGAQDHSFTNPAGVRCNFMTFSHCDNVIVHEELFFQHSWFPGYGWRFLLCGACFQHLGWKYDAVLTAVRPETFFGVLIDAIETGSEKN